MLMLCFIVSFIQLRLVPIASQSVLLEDTWLIMNKHWLLCGFQMRYLAAACRAVTFSLAHPSMLFFLLV